jgi:hypothetical protein
MRENPIPFHLGEKPMISRFLNSSRTCDRHCAVCGQEGSIILIVLMLLVIMSLIGISSIDITVTESFMVRNTALRKQNLHLADAAAMEAVQRTLDAGLNDNPALTLEIDNILPDHPDHEPWVRPRSEFEAGALYTRWYDRQDVGPVLNAGNSEIPLSIQNGDIATVSARGELNGSIRYALVGWEFKTSGAGNLNLASGQPILRIANVLTEYMSDRNGVIRLTVGVEREFMN